MDFYLNCGKCSPPSDLQLVKKLAEKERGGGKNGKEKMVGNFGNGAAQSDNSIFNIRKLLRYRVSLYLSSSIHHTSDV